MGFFLKKEKEFDGDIQGNKNFKKTVFVLFLFLSDLWISLAFITAFLNGLCQSRALLSHLISYFSQ